MPILRRHIKKISKAPKKFGRHRRKSKMKDKRPKGLRSH